MSDSSMFSLEMNFVISKYSKSTVIKTQFISHNTNITVSEQFCKYALFSYILPNKIVYR